MESQGEFKKIRPPTYNGQSKEAKEAWLLNINWYFQVYDYSSKLKAKLSTNYLHRKSSLWLEEVIIMHTLDNKSVNLEEF